MQTTDFTLEIGAMNYGFDIDGIIGLSLLRMLKAIINIDDLSLYSNR
ncbi:hypothetical protein WKU33_17855 [Oceanobacillus sp. HCA-5259]